MKSERCPICSSTARQDQKSYLELALNQAPKPYEIFHCKGCGLRWMSPHPTPDDYQTIYDSSYYESEQEMGGSYREEKLELLPCYSNLAKRFQSFGITSKLLDIGCGTGDFLISAQEHGISGTGVEPSRHACQQAAAAGLTVHEGTLSDLSPDNGPYAAVHCSHVLEHVPDAHAFIEQIKDITQPGAPVYIEVPIQFDGLLDMINRLRRQQRRYSDHSIHHHYFFTPKAIKQLLTAHGFEIISLTTFLPCRRALRKSGLRKWLLQSLLWMADHIKQRGDVISVWARRERE